MVLEMKTKCDNCDYVFHEKSNAFICVKEHTFCRDCAENLYYVCPECSGELVVRPKLKADENTIMSDR
ncbi:alginate lyase [Mammaliicoccus lentus]|jgi:hypothetical protein|uniref:DUF1272 domain-containing protein n=2 Tax=Mammaliicoccus lentus TaxID=42858 RepID=A0AAP1RTY1_MAMLE|nr:MULTISPECIES: DUF1272 domain-containing protein [Mammaliicoccus]HBV04844.1 DUF1272 domain-containing protein [Staphylococcus sp.]MBF0748184.1 DUF1272 domain-containing protein [Mammaliicoccus lentus]MBF0794173.1 DUF1272 domain-containing protein [Mammaliicoccus lentus]MBF0842857.1 DUF1272 domain-containing protein [Mammaliicoccus lentus]MBU6113094.1 DUF1272 domain-containing protein [Mammaliicoccus lentus]